MFLVPQLRAERGEKSSRASEAAAAAAAWFHCGLPGLPAPDNQPHLICHLIYGTNISIKLNSPAQ